MHLTQLSILINHNLILEGKTINAILNSRQLMGRSKFTTWETVSIWALWLLFIPRLMSLNCFKWLSRNKLIPWPQIGEPPDLPRSRAAIPSSQHKLFSCELGSEAQDPRKETWKAPFSKTIDLLHFIAMAAALMAPIYNGLSRSPMELICWRLSHYKPDRNFLRHKQTGFGGGGGAPPSLPPSGAPGAHLLTNL